MSKYQHTSPEDPDRAGRDARQPQHIPVSGWKAILKRMANQFGDDQVLLVAAGVTFYLLLAMVPALTAMVSIYGLAADPAEVQRHLSALQRLIPGGAQEVIGEQLNRLAAQAGRDLGLALGGSVLVALWSANAGTKALFTAMNVAYDEEERRGFLRLTLVSLGFTFGSLALMALLLASVFIVPNVAAWLGLSTAFGLSIKALTLAALLAASLATLAALYRWGPSRASAKWSWITPGAVLAVVIAGIVSTAFSWYIGNFGSYNRTYGSLGAIIGFMTWIWAMVTVVITGAELNAEMEHQTRRDTTTGPERAMGARGARKADTLPTRQT